MDVGGVVVGVSGGVSVSAVIWGAVGSGSGASFSVTSEGGSPGVETLGTIVSSSKPRLSNIVGFVDLSEGLADSGRSED